jgi:predicted O-methyltransferase YrrM
MQFFDKTCEDILSELEKTQKDFWNLDRNCACFLYQLILMKNAKNVLEIGTSNGYSGIWILKALEKTKGKLTTIEFWEKRQSIARKNFQLCAPNADVEPKIGSAIVVLEDLEEEILNKKREKYDFVFIDANKKEYLDYINIINKIVSPDAVILADNILSHKEKVQPYVEKMYNDKTYVSQILDLGTGMMLSVKLK